MWNMIRPALRTAKASQKTQKKTMYVHADGASDEVATTRKLVTKMTA